MTTRYFNVKEGITTGNIILDAATSNITGISNIAIVGTANAAFFSGDGGLLSNIAAGNITGQVGNALIAGTVYTNAQPNITSLGTLTSLDVTGNIGAGNVNGGNLVTANYFAGTLTTAAQPNITSVGNLTGLTIGNATSNVVVSDGNVTATGNISANNFSGNFSGNIVAPGGAGANTQIIFNNGGLLGVSSAFTFDSAGNLLTVNGNVSAGNANLGNLATANYFTGTLTTAAQPNITSVGTLTSLDVTGNVSAGNVSGTLLTGTLTTAAQPNITSVGTLTSLDVTGNVSSGNVSTGIIVASGDISGNNATITNQLSAGTLVSNSLTAIGSNSLTLTAGTGNANVVLVPSGTGTVDVSSKRITNLATPTQASDAATKQYVDDVAQGLHVHASCGAATPNTLAVLSGGTVTYNNGTDGVGATLITTGTYTLIDGVNVASSGFRILVKNEANAAHNGIYTYSNGTTLIRATDFDTAIEIAGGDFTFVTGGTLYDSTGWVQVDEVTVVGTDPIEWDQFSGAGQYTAGAGLTLTGTEFSVNVDEVTTTITGDAVVVKAGAVFVTPNIGAATGTSLNVSGNIDAGNFTTTGIVSGGNASITGNVSAGNITVTGDISATTLAGNLTTATQSNITTVGTLSNLAANGTVNFTGAGNVTLGNIGNVHIGGGSAGQYLQTDGSGGLSFGTVDTDTLSNGTSNVDIATANGNVTVGVGGNANIAIFTSTGANITGYLAATGNLTVLNANLGNLATANHFSGDGGLLSNIAGANVTGQVGNALLAGTVYTNAQPNITSVGTLTGLDVTGVTNLGNVGNVIITGGTSGYVLSTNGSGNLSWTDAGSVGVAGSNTQVQFNNANSFGASANFTFNNTTNTLTATNIAGDGAGLSNIAGANVTGQVGNALVAGTVYTNAQPNITSVGTLTSLAVTGTVTAGNVALNGGLTSNRSNVSVTSNTVIDQFNPSTFRTAKYVISASGDNGYQSVETLLVHDGSSAYITIYGSICSNVTADIVDISSNINGASGNVSVYATASGANTKVNIVASYINV